MSGAPDNDIRPSLHVEEAQIGAAVGVRVVQGTQWLWLTRLEAVEVWRRLGDLITEGRWE